MREASPRKIRTEVTRNTHSIRQAIPIIIYPVVDEPITPRQHIPLRTLVREVASRGRFSMSQIAGALGISAGDPNRYLAVVAEVVDIPGYRPTARGGTRVYITQPTR